MSEKSFEKLLLSEEIMLLKEEINRFELFKEELINWNKKINLTRITEENEIYYKHFLDSLQVCKYLNEKDKIIDVGTGAGFPGIPIKIHCPNVELTLLDSVNKKIMYLKDVVQKLQLEDVEFIHGRVEDVGNDKKYREKFDVAVSRAVANMSTLVEYLIPLVKVNGRIICMKGPNIEEELENAKNAINILGGEIEKVESYKLPNMDCTYNMIIIRKIKNTPSQYPRKAGTPSNSPIK